MFHIFMDRLIVYYIKLFFLQEDLPTKYYNIPHPTSIEEDLPIIYNMPHPTTIYILMEIIFDH